MATTRCMARRALTESMAVRAPMRSLAAPARISSRTERAMTAWRAMRERKPQWEADETASSRFKIMDGKRRRALKRILIGAIGVFDLFISSAGRGQPRRDLLEGPPRNLQGREMSQAE